MKFQLGNGLTVVGQEQHAARVAAFQVWVKVGSADESPEEIGLAHLHEHMLFKGTARRGLGEIARSVEAHGGEINAWTSFDQTAYHVVLASRFAREGLDVLADAVRASAFDAAELGREIEVVCEEIKRSLDMPSRRASKDLFSARYQQHAYGRPVIGFEENVRAHTRDRVVAFYQKHYVPSNMVLAAAGDFTEAQLKAWAEELFGGDWGRTRGQPWARVKEPEPTSVRTVLKADDVKEAWVNLAFALPGAEHPDTPALDVLAMLAGQGDGARLSLEVKRKRGLVNDVSAYAYTPHDDGLFAAGFTTAHEKATEAFEAVARVLRGLCVKPVDPAELDTVKGLIESEAVYQRETAQGMARKLGYYQAALGGIEREAAYYEAVAQVTPRQLLEVARRYLRFDRAIVTGLLPKGSDFDETDARAVLERVADTEGQTVVSRQTAVPAGAMRVTGSARRAAGLVVERLPNGATVLVREERSVPLFAVRAAFHGGLRVETEAVNGISTLLTRSWMRGSAKRDAETISQQIDAMAGGMSAVAGRSSLSVRGEFLSKHFARAFDLFSEVLLEPSFPSAEVQRERGVQLQAIATRDDKPSAVAFEQLARLMYRSHPYRLSMVGERASVEKLGSAELKAWHHQHAQPAGMVLAVVGDVDADEVLKRAREAFGARSGAASAKLELPAEPAWSGPREAKRVLQKAQTHVVLGFPGARVSDPWRRALDVVSTILSGQSGRLFLELRDKQSLAYSVSSMSIEGVDPGYFAVYIGTSPEKVDTALAGMRRELKRLRDEPVSEAELSRAREHLIGVHEIGLQRNGARAATMALDQLYGLGAEAYLQYPDEIAAIDAKAVRDVAERVLDFDKCALSIVGP
ncbi:MAG: insulinase family protein [Archangiaceae bacterium]|nr:insulinase family protein [Archangiaceae bacterium]